jgi:hypothetical protein
MDHKALQGLMDHKVLKVQQVRQAIQDFKGQLELREVQETLVVLVL